MFPLCVARTFRLATRGPSHLGPGGDARYASSGMTFVSNSSMPLVSYAISGKYEIV